MFWDELHKNKKEDGDIIDDISIFVNFEDVISKLTEYNIYTNIITKIPIYESDITFINMKKTFMDMKKTHEKNILNLSKHLKNKNFYISVITLDNILGKFVEKEYTKIKNIIKSILKNANVTYSDQQLIEIFKTILITNIFKRKDLSKDNFKFELTYIEGNTANEKFIFDTLIDHIIKVHNIYFISKDLSKISNKKKEASK